MTIEWLVVSYNMSQFQGGILLKNKDYIIPSRRVSCDDQHRVLHTYSFLMMMAQVHIYNG